LAHLAPEELHDARLGAERLASREPRQRAPVVEARDLDLDEVPRPALPDCRLAAAGRRAVDAIPREALEVVGQHPVDDELARRGAALVREGGASDRPAVVL